MRSEWPVRPRREYERRKAKDEERLRQKWGKFGGIAVAISDERQSTKAWSTGAVGEERLGTRLDSLVSESIAVLHDRRIPGCSWVEGPNAECGQSTLGCGDAVANEAAQVARLVDQECVRVGSFGPPDCEFSTTSDGWGRAAAWWETMRWESRISRRLWPSG